MSIEIIDLLKPKNGLNFKLIEDIDVAVSGYTSLADAVAHLATKEGMISAINTATSGKQDALTEPQLTAANSGITSALVTQIGTNTTAIAGKADAADLTALESEVDTKATTTALNTATTNLQSQIDLIVTPVTQDAEVQNARVDAEGVTHTTLKARIDNTESNLNDLKDVVLDVDTETDTITEESSTVTEYGSNGYVKGSDGTFKTDDNMRTYLWTVPYDTEFYIEATVESGHSVYCSAVVYNSTIDTLPTTNAGASSIYVQGGGTSASTLPTSNSKWSASKNYTIAISINIYSSFTLHYENNTYALNSIVSLSDAQIEQVVGSTAITTLSGDVTTLGNDVSDITDNVTDLQGERVYKAENLRSTNAAEVILTGDNINSVSTAWNTQNIKLTGRNRLDIDSFTNLRVNSHNSSYTVTKYQNGIKITSLTDDTSFQTVYAYLDYVAEYTGKLFVSCKSSIENIHNDNIRNVAFRVAIKRVGEEAYTSQQLIKNIGDMYESVDVNKGDAIQLRFYCHVSTPYDATGVYIYDDIMVAYGGLYDYEPFIPATFNKDISTYNIPTDTTKMTNKSTLAGNNKYRVVFDDLLPLSEFSADNDSLPPNVEIQGDLSLVTYNDCYNNVDGVGISSSGQICIYVDDAAGKTALADWLELHPIAIKYISSEGEYKKIDHLFRAGEAITFSSAQSLNYKYSPKSRKTKLVCFGDSITGMWDNDTGYPFVITNESDIEAYNIGFSGCQYTDHSTARYMPFSMNRLVDAIVANESVIMKSLPKSSKLTNNLENGSPKSKSL